MGGSSSTAVGDVVKGNAVSRYVVVDGESPGQHGIHGAESDDSQCADRDSFADPAGATGDCLHLEPSHAAGANRGDDRSDDFLRDSGCFARSDSSGCFCYHANARLRPRSSNINPGCKLTVSTVDAYLVAAVCAANDDETDGEICRLQFAKRLSQPCKPGSGPHSDWGGSCWHRGTIKCCPVRPKPGCEYCLDRPHRREREYELAASRPAGGRHRASA